MSLLNSVLKVFVGDKINLNQQTIIVEDSSYLADQFLIYNKRENEICSRNDPEGRTTTFSSLPELNNQRWISVGRLDIDTSGLLLFTTNGDTANKLMHPTNGFEREYMVRIYGTFTKDIEYSLKNGIHLTDGLGFFKEIKHIKGASNNKWLRVIVTEGRNRFVKRMLENQGLKVSRLIRIRFGRVILPKSLKKGMHKLVQKF